MKKKIIYLTFLLISLCCEGQTVSSTATGGGEYISVNHNKLDDINSSSEIEIILKSIDEDYRNFKVNTSMEIRFSDGLWSKPNKEGQHLADSLKIKAWTKEDFDGNGYTDLLVVGSMDSIHSVICLMDSGGNRFFIKDFWGYVFPVVATINNKPVIHYFNLQMNWRPNKPERDLKIDTLVYLFGDFIELNKTPASHKIEKINYSTDGCMGTCPIFELTINSNRSATYNAQFYNERVGEFSARIDTTNFNQLVNLLNYIDFAELDSNYTVYHSDDQDCSLKITYDNGQIKNINDYGLIGTFGLARTYEMLFKLRENQKWK